MEYEHLDHAAIEALEFSLADRLVLLDQELYISWDDAEAAIDRISQLIQMPTFPRRPCMVLFGEPGIGKTKVLIEAARRAGVPVTESLGAITGGSIFCFSGAGIYSLASFWERVYSAMGIPVPRKPSAHHFCFLLSRAEVRLLVIDEAQDLRLLLAREFAIVMSLIKEITNLLGRPLVIMGSLEVKNLTQNDQHLHQRFGAPYLLRRWSDVELLREFICALLRQLPFREPSPITDDNTLMECIRATGGNTDAIVKVVRGAARSAMKAGRNCISTDDLAPELTRLSPLRAA